LSENERLDVNDLGNGGPASILLRRVTGGVGLTITLEKDGDVEVIVSDADFARIHNFLASFNGRS